MTTDQKINAKRRSIERTLSGYPFPDFEVLRDKANPNFDTTFSYAMNFANYTYEHDDLKGYAQEYAPSMNMSKIPDWEFFHIGIMAWLHVKGAMLTKEQIATINTKLETLYIKYNVVEAKPVDLRARRTENLMGELSGVLDDVLMKRTVIQPSKLIEDAGTVDIERIKAHYESLLAEISNKDLSEFFPDAKRLIVGLTIILKDLDKQKTLKGKARKTRIMKPRKINPSKMVRRLKYLKSISLNEGVDNVSLTSIDPEKIVGAQILWVFNVKTRKLGRYDAKDGEVLLVKGSTILNYENTSVHKKIRKPNEVLVKLLAAGKVEQRKILDSIRAVESPLTGRINKDTILLRVF